MRPGTVRLMIRRTLAVALLVTSSLSSCDVVLGEQGSGVIATRRFDLPAGVQRIELGDAFRATITTGTMKPSATVAMDDNLLDRLDVEIDGDTVAIDLGGRVRDATLRVAIGVIRLRELRLTGASHASVEEGLGLTDDVTVEGSGASEVRLGSVDLDEFDVSLSGASKLSGARGGANQITAEVSGASTLALFGVEADEAQVDVSGASRAEVTVRDRLEATASGASTVTYQGDPDHVIRDESGASSIEPA
jgi:hypothetical protein